MAQATTCGTDVLPFVMPLMTTAAAAAKTKKTGMAVLLMRPGRRILQCPNLPMIGCAQSILMQDSQGHDSFTEDALLSAWD